jgi:hypothetical protein
MKGALLGAAAVLLGSANAGVHKMKLKKIPLSEQLVCPIPQAYSNVLQEMMLTISRIRRPSRSNHRSADSVRSTWVLDLTAMPRLSSRAATCTSRRTIPFPSPTS